MIFDSLIISQLTHVNKKAPGATQLAFNYQLLIKILQYLTVVFLYTSFQSPRQVHSLVLVPSSRSPANESSNICSVPTHRCSHQCSVLMANWAVKELSSDSSLSAAFPACFEHKLSLVDFSRSRCWDGAQGMLYNKGVSAGVGRERSMPWAPSHVRLKCYFQNPCVILQPWELRSSGRCFLLDGESTLTNQTAGGHWLSSQLGRRSFLQRVSCKAGLWI